ncbi:MAG: alanine racemase [Candidatus Omnitrophica bacterium]|nr:alanine racemase [Candidatus Omnitrophota bacterium]
MYRPLWIEVNLGNLNKNLRLMKRLLGKSVQVLATVKQNAYGHGLIPVARKLSDSGVDFFGVGSLEEAIFLRKAKIKEPVLILSPLLPLAVKDLLAYRVTPTVVDLSLARELNKEACKNNQILAVHVKVDTGMGRLGVWHRQAEDFICKLKNFKNLSLEGLFTHFPVADTDPKFTRCQITFFNSLLERCRAKGIGFKYIHCANSSALIKYKEAHFNLVRLGLALYGIKPHKKMSQSLYPVLSLKSKVIFLKGIERGRSISYGRTYISKRPTSIVTISCGYADGYPWNLSNKGKVIIKNRFFKIAGRVCMDHLMADIGNNKEIKTGTEVVLIGKSGNLEITPEYLAKLVNTIPYEIVSRLSSNIPRIYKYSKAHRKR